MNVMVVEEGEGDLYFICQALEALGGKMIRSPSLDEDKVLFMKVDVVVHVWSDFTADVETVQVKNIMEADPKVVVVIFARGEDVAHLRRQFPTALVADMRALEESYAARTAQAIVDTVRRRRPQAVATA